MGNLMEKELRKQQNILVEAGTGTILLAVWSVAKVNLYLGLASVSIEDVYSAAEKDGINPKWFLVFMVTLLVIILLVQLLTRLYVGLSAIAEGKGKEKRWGYIALSAVILVMDLQTSYQAFWADRIRLGEPMTFDSFTSLCMELVSAYVLLELMICSIRVKKLRKNRKV